MFTRGLLIGYSACAINYQAFILSAPLFSVSQRSAFMTCMSLVILVSKHLQALI